MATRRFGLYVPPKQRDPIEGQPIGTRLGHEHDMNDAFDARLDWYTRYKSLEKSVEEGAKKKEKEVHQKGVGSKFMILVWCNLYAFLLISMLKVMKVL